MSAPAVISATPNGSWLTGDIPASNPVSAMAYTYAALNMPVFPLRANGKEPLFPGAHPDGDPLRGKCHGECGRLGHGMHDATVCLDTIREWWDLNPEANVGIRPWDRIAVVDVDVADSKPGRATLDRLIAELGPLPDTWIAETATGGRHIWLDIGDTSRVHKAIGPGVDIKVGGTGYLVAAPSVRSMGIYRWCSPDASGLPAGLPAAAPETWRQAICKPAPVPRPSGPVQPPAASGQNPVYVAAAVAGELAKLATATPGGQNGTGVDDTLIAVACRILGFAKGGHVDRQAAENEMKRIAMALGHSDAYAQKTLNSAWDRTEPEHPPERRAVTPAYVIDPAEDHK